MGAADQPRWLSAAEQEFIVESIKYVNQTIKSAAARANIRYIDIQDALGDQAMCGKGGAMTDPLDYVSSGIMAALKRGETVDQIAREYGLVDPASKMLLAALYNNMKNVEDTANFAQNPLVNLASVVQQLSHPNAEGHRLIANKIIDAISDGGSILAASCDEKVIFCPNSNNMVEPTRPTYFGPALTRTGIMVEIASVALDNTAGALSPDRSLSLIDGIVAARRSAEVILRLMPSFGVHLSNIHAVLHSDEYDLGDLAIDPQGGYSAHVTIPSSIPVGMHIIEVVGTAADGTIYKALSPAIIVGSLDDEDADGVLDDEDKWLFRTAPIDKTGSKEGEQLKLIGSASPQFLKSGIAQEGREGAAAYIVSHDTTRSQIDNQVPGLMGGLGVSEKNSSTDIDVATVAPLLAFVLLCILVFLLRRRSKGAQ